MHSKNKKMFLFTILSICFLFLIIFSLENDTTVDSNKQEKTQINEDIPENKQDLIKPAVNDPNNKSGYFNLINEKFDNGNNWDFYPGYGATYSVSGGKVRVDADSDYDWETIYIVYKNSLPYFVGGNISFDYNFVGTSEASKELRCAITWNRWGGVWDTVWNTYTSTATDQWQNTGNIDISGYDYTDDPGFCVEIHWRASRSIASIDYLEIDNFTLGNYEFTVSETDGDPVTSTQDQNITLFVDPNFSSFVSNNVTMRYNVNSYDLDAGYFINSTDTSNLYNFGIPQSRYVPGDVVYYQFTISNTSGALRKSSIFSFLAYDNLPPSITNIENNATTYYQDVLIKCNVSESGFEGSLKNVTMYINSGSEAFKLDILILSNRSGSIPVNGGFFGFTISKQYLSARAGEVLHYKIYAVDNTNEVNSGDDVLTVLDDISPNISFKATNALSSGIENNKSLIVTYNVTEHVSGSGLKNASLFVKISNTPSPPNDENDYNIEPLSPTGGIADLNGGLLNFTVPENLYGYNDYIYFFLNATDYSGNVKCSFSDYRTVFSNDTIAPVVNINALNGQNVEYNISKTLSFTITEPIGASGIDNASVILYYEVGGWTNPQNIEKDLYKYGGVLSFLIDADNYSYGETVYYQLNMSDNAENKYSSIIGSFFVSDTFDPSIEFISYSNPNPEYTDNFNITFYIEKDSDSSLLSLIELYVKNSSDPWTNKIKIYDTNSSLILGTGGYVYFEINSSITYARYLLNWVIIATDGASNQKNLTSSIIIHDLTNPSALYNSNNWTIWQDQFNYDQSAAIYYDIWEPEQGAGFFNNGFRLKLYYKIGVSNNPNDYSGTINVLEGFVASYGGTYTFVIAASVLFFDDTVVFWLNCSDIQGRVNNTWNDRRTIYINDTIAPGLSLNNVVNNATISYLQNKTIKYTPREFIDSSGLKNATLYWKINSSPTLVDYNGLLTYNYIPFYVGGSELNWELDRLLLNYGYLDNVFFFIQVFDTAGNERISNINNFYINDTIKPIITFLGFSNFTNIEYYQNFNATYRITDDIGGSGIYSVELFVKNASMSWINAIKIFKQNTTLTGFSGDISFEINNTLLSAKQLLNLRLIVKDIANNYETMINSIVVYDYNPPQIKFNSYNGSSSNTYEYNKNAAICYTFYEPSRAIGFNLDASGLTLYYHNGISIGPNDYDGFSSVYNTSYFEHSGIYAFIIPESFLIYGRTIYFWINGTDKNGNLNCTWDEKESIIIVDTTAPLVSLDSMYNSNSISYHLDKKIRFKAIEYSDSSKLFNITLYWGKNYVPSISTNDGYLTYDNLTGNDFGENYYYWIIDNFEIGFKYGDEIYFIIQIYDGAKNSNISTANSFTITDTIAPSYIEDPNNYEDFTWRLNKTVIFTVFDPHYDNSSGISSVTIYWRAGSNPTTTVYHGKVSNTTCPLQSSNYYFKITLNQTLYNISPYIYYFIEIYDVVGNSINSSTNSFRIYDYVYKPESIIGPNTNIWLSTKDIRFYVELYFEMNLWIIINDLVFRYNDSILIFDEIITFNDEGATTVQFKFLNNESILTFSFNLDLSPPGQITEISLEAYGTSIIVIKWDAPKGTDSKTDYKIYKSTKSGFKISKSLLIATVGVNDDLSIEDTEIEAGKTYYYIIVAIDRVGHQSKPSEAASIKIAGNEYIYIIVILLIAGITSISIVLIRKKKSGKKLQRLLSEDGKEFQFDEKFTTSKKVVDSEKKWITIETKPKPKSPPPSETESSKNDIEFD